MLDNCDGVFIPFHSCATFAVTVVAESFLSNNNPITIRSNPLDEWKHCKFTGKENFQQVCQI
jgi:hypothetical protein